MIPAWICAALMQQAQPSAVEQALAAGDFHAAWEAAESAPDELARNRSRSVVLYRAGDPAGALAAASAGLAEAPDDLQLLYRAAGAAIWLQDAAAAARHAQSLERAVEASDGLAPDEREGWRQAASDFVRRSEAIARHDRAREHALARARALSIAAFAAVLLVLGWLTRPGYGRSSRPVS